MIAKFILYAAMSLGGHLAREDGSVDWLESVAREGEDYGFATFFAGVDSVVMGRHTYEFSRRFEPWPYPGKRSYVLSGRNLDSLPEEVRQLGSSVPEAVGKIEADGGRRIWLVGGGKLVSSFLREHRIDEMILSVLPLLLGAGLPLFPAPIPETEFELVTVRRFDSGLVQLHHRCVDRPVRRP